MYRISNNKRKYSPTPIVRVVTDENGKEKEIYVGCLASPKVHGDELSEKIVEFLNNDEELFSECPHPPTYWYWGNEERTIKHCAWCGAKNIDK